MFGTNPACNVTADLWKPTGYQHLGVVLIYLSVGKVGCELQDFSQT